jgi:site-specific recombinase XerC
MLVPALRGFFHFLLRDDVVAAKPARGTRTPTYPKRLTRHLSREQMDGAFAEAEQAADRG